MNWKGESADAFTGERRGWDSFIQDFCFITFSAGHSEVVWWYTSNEMDTQSIVGSCLNIGLVILSPDYRVIGMNPYARKVLGSEVVEFGKKVSEYHSKKSYQKVEALLQEAVKCDSDTPLTMIIDILHKVLMINIFRIDTEASQSPPLIAMSFLDVTEQTGARLNPRTGVVELKKFPVCDRGGFIFLDMSSIYFIRSEGNYCKVFAGNNSYFIHLTLKNILKRYAGRKFFRAHRSFIVNTAHILSIQRDDRGRTSIIFDSENIPKVPLARRRVRDLRDLLALA